MFTDAIIFFGWGLAENTSNNDKGLAGRPAENNVELPAKRPVENYDEHATTIC